MTDIGMYGEVMYLCESLSPLVSFPNQWQGSDIEPLLFGKGIVVGTKAGAAQVRARAAALRHLAVALGVTTRDAVVALRMMTQAFAAPIPPRPGRAAQRLTQAIDEPPDTPFEDWCAGVEQLLKDVDTQKKSHDG